MVKNISGSSGQEGSGISGHQAGTLSYAGQNDTLDHGHQRASTLCHDIGIVEQQVSGTIGH